eukprot:TRINITY_DN20782_c0_g2_i1.p1 TRINITY_DN20782_c0_g2~~TRINITY_DN20782_c0_g2_i1.p1  ORF type:complete len:245 (-),score=47.15 TRINITY_DN20782_c0_g2_i1:319-1053(-)
MILQLGEEYGNLCNGMERSKEQARALTSQIEQHGRVAAKVRSDVEQCSRLGMHLESTAMASAPLELADSVTTPIGSGEQEPPVTEKLPLAHRIKMQRDENRLLETRLHAERSAEKQADTRKENCSPHLEPTTLIRSCAPLPKEGKHQQNSLCKETGQPQAASKPPFSPSSNPNPNPNPHPTKPSFSSSPLAAARKQAQAAIRNAQRMSSERNDRSTRVSQQPDDSQVDVVRSKLEDLLEVINSP